MNGPKPIQLFVTRSLLRRTQTQTRLTKILIQLFIWPSPLERLVHQKVLCILITLYWQMVGQW